MIHTITQAEYLGKMAEQLSQMTGRLVQAVLQSQVLQCLGCFSSKNMLQLVSLALQVPEQRCLSIAAVIVKHVNSTKQGQHVSYHSCCCLLRHTSIFNLLQVRRSSG